MNSFNPVPADPTIVGLQMPLFTPLDSRDLTPLDSCELTPLASHQRMSLESLERHPAVTTTSPSSTSRWLISAFAAIVAVAALGVVGSAAINEFAQPAATVVPVSAPSALVPALASPPLAP